MPIEIAQGQEHDGNIVSEMNLHLHLARMRRDDGTAQGRMPPRAAAAVLLPPFRVAPPSACTYTYFLPCISILR